MRVCMLLPEVYPPDIRVEKEVRALREAGHEVYVLSQAADNRPRRERVDGAHVIRRPVRDAHDGLRGIFPALQYLLTFVHRGWTNAARDVIEAEDIQALHAHDLPVVKTAIKLGEEYGIPVVADLHENWPEAKRYYRKGTMWNNMRSNPKLIAPRILKSIRRLKQFERYSVQHADRVIAVVEEGKQHYVDDCGASSEKVHVVSNVVDLEAFDTADITSVGYEDEFVLSYVGTLTGEHRGLRTVVRAMPTIADQGEDARLLIVGPTSDYARSLRQLSADVGVEEHVTFTGRVPFNEVPSYIAASDVCLVPHRKNPHTETTVPHKLFQYMAVGKPVIVTDVTPLARIVSRSEAGLVVPPDDPEELAKAATELSRNPAKREELGRNGRQAVEEKYNWKVEGETLRKLYETLQSESSPIRTEASVD